jgi:hypothetical protein
VRPVRIDHFAIVGLDLTGKYDGEVPEVLDEGAGVRVVVAAAPRRPVELTGMIWGDKFRRVVTVDERVLAAAAAWVFGEDDHHDLSRRGDDDGGDDGPGGVAGDVVPGDRARGAAVDDRPRGEGTGTGSAVALASAASARGQGGLRRCRRSDALLLGAAAACVKQHQPAAGWSVHLDLETTGHEVVDVVPGAGAATRSARAWSRRSGRCALPTSFVAERAMHPLDFR